MYKLFTLIILVILIQSCAHLPIGEKKVVGEYTVIGNKNGVTIVKYHGQTAKLIIPNKIGSMNVTKIGNNSFANCKFLTSVVIPNSVDSIGNFAFDNCISLISIKMPTKMSSIGKGAFAYCDSLKSITLPTTITTIYNLTFSYSGLTSIEIPDSVTRIGNNAFGICPIKSVKIPKSVIYISPRAFGNSDLEEIIVNQDNKYFSSKDGILFDKEMKTLLIHPPEWINKQSNRHGSYVTPFSVTRIANFAFQGILNSLTISSKVKWISDDAFRHAYIKYFVVDSKNESFCSKDGVLFNKEWEDPDLGSGLYLVRYPNNEKESYIIPDTVSSVNSYAFHRTNLKSITMLNDTYLFENAITDEEIKIHYIEREDSK